VLNTNTYADLELRILECQEAGYPVEITLAGGQEFPRGFLAADILPWTSTGDPHTDGQRLFAALFRDAEARRAWDRACGQHPQRRVRLRLDATAPELHALPWELLHDGQTFLVADAATPFSRYLPLPDPPGGPVIARPIRILAVIANPADLAQYSLTPLDVAAERQSLETALSGLPMALLHLDFLDAPVTPERLERALATGYHVLHFVGHGTFSQRRGQAALYLQDDTGNTRIITDDDLSAMLKRQATRPHLVFLAACQSAERSMVDAFAGLAPQLIQAGIPAVVAMRDKVALAMAGKLTSAFYGALLRHGEIDRALNAARSLLLTGQSPDAGVPVLLMRLKDGKLWETAQATAPARRDFYTHAPRLEAERYVNRPHEYAQIKTLLLADPMTERLTTALYGAGGFGKTTLARVLCDNVDIQVRFADGILWATLGEKPDVPARLREWVTALGGVISENAPTIPQLVNRLTDLLRDGAYLLLIDDVWDSAALTPFLCGGPRCAHVVTTRNRATLPAGVQDVAVDTMRPAEAIALLSYGVAADAPESPALQTLAQRLGHWPLLLGIINGVLREMCAQGASLADALAYVAEGLAEEGLTVFDTADATDRARAVRTTLEVSLKRLAPTDRARYTELAIFPEDADIPATAAARLWGQTGGLSEFKTKDLFRRLDSTSLVQTYDAEHQIVRLHDAVRVYLADVLGSEGCVTAHRALLDAYRQTVTLSVAEGSPTPWHTAPDDGYLYAHVAYHLDALAATDADAAAELTALFATDAWLQVRVAADDYTYDGYLADLEYAWRRAEDETRQQIAKDKPLEAMVKCVRYALIRATVNSLIANYVSELIVRAVEIGLWSAKRALSVTAKMSSNIQRAKMYTLLLDLDVLNLTQQQVAQIHGVEAARMIWQDEARVKALAAIAKHLSGSLQNTVVRECLATIRGIEHSDECVEALAALAPYLTGDSLIEGLTIAQTIEWEQYQVEALAVLIPYLTGEAQRETQRKALMVALASKWRQAELLITLAPYLTEDLLTTGLSAALAITNKYCQAQVLLSLIPQLTGSMREHILATVKMNAERIQPIKAKLLVWVSLAGYLDQETQSHILKEVSTAAREIANEVDQLEVLIELSQKLTGDARQFVLAQGLAVTRMIKTTQEWTKAVNRLAPYLEGNLLATGLSMAQAIKDEFHRAKVLIALSSKLTGDLLVKAFAMARTITWSGGRGEVLAALAPYLTEDLLVESLSTTRITDELYQVRVLEMLVPHLIGSVRESVLENGLTLAWRVSNAQDRVEALAALIPHLTGEVQNNALAGGLTALQEIKNAMDLIRVCGVLAKQFENTPQVHNLLMTVFAAAQSSDGRPVDWDRIRVEGLASLIPYLAGDERENALAEALETTRAFVWPGYKAEALAALAPHLIGDMQAEGLAIALTIEWEMYRAKALAALAPHLIGALRLKVLTEALTIEDEYWRVKILAALLPHLDGDVRESALAKGLSATRAIKSTRGQAEALITLLPYFTSTLAQQLQHEYQIVILMALRSCENSEREHLLKLVADKTVFNLDALILTPQAIMRIAEAVIDFCQRWRWL